jgi:hypothetical protein
MGKFAEINKGGFDATSWNTIVGNSYQRIQDVFPRP